MRKVAMAMLAGAALAWAGAVQAASAQQNAQDKASSASADVKQGAQDTKAGAQKQAHKASQKAKKEGAKAKKTTAAAFQGKSNFEVKGKIEKVSRDRITVARQDLPPATLDVSKETKIQVNGNASSVDQLRQGQDVQASFNLRGDKPLAVEIKANKAGK